MTAWRGRASTRITGRLGVQDEDDDMSKVPIKRYELPVGSTATIVDMVIEDDDGAAIDLSGATGDVLFNAITAPPDPTQVTDNAAAGFRNDGSDGLVSFQLTNNEASEERELWCDFEVQGINGGNLVSYRFVLDFIGRARA